MDCYTDSEFGESRGRVVWLIQAISCLISLFGSCFILVNYFLLSQGRNPLVKLVAMLSFCDVCWVAVKLIHFELNSIDYGWTGDYFYGCVAIRLAWQFFAGTTVLWTCCISFFLWRTVCRKDKGPSIRQWLCFHSIAWGLPFLSVIALGAGGHSTMSHSVAMGTCYPVWYLHITLWFLPVVLCFVFNVVLYVIIAWNIRRTLKLIPTLGPRRTHSVYRKFTFYILVYLICWPLDITNSVIHYSRGNETKCHYYLLICLYSALLNIQGFLNFLVYGFTNKKIYSQFFGGNLWVTLKACAVFFLSPALLAPAALWYSFCAVRRAYGGGSTREMTKEEMERQQKIMEAKKEREERARRITQQVWGSKASGEKESGEGHAYDMRGVNLQGDELRPARPSLLVNDGSGMYSGLTDPGST